MNVTITTYRVVTRNDERYVEFGSLAVASAKARYFSQKYGRTFSVVTVRTTVTVEQDETPGNDTGYDTSNGSDIYYCGKCGASGDQPCTTKSGKKATKNHVGRSNK